MQEISPGVAALLGIVEGLTEFLPVSSTGHLILAGHWLQTTGVKAHTFEIFIQLGAILAIVVLYWRRFQGLFSLAWDKGESFSGLQGVAKLSAACLPAFVIGGIFGPLIKDRLFFPAPVAVALLVGGVLILWLDSSKRRVNTAALEKVTLGQALLVGIFQCLALWPGMSRSASTIIGGLLLGFERRVAAEFSFLVAVPVMTVATLYDLFKNWNLLSAADFLPFAIGFIVAFLSAALAVKFFIALLQRFTLRPFGIYRVALGVLVLWVLS